MSLIPDFGIGFWNAWFFSLAFWLPLILYKIINKEDKGKAKKMGAGVTPENKTKRILEKVIFGITLLTMVYAIFLPFKLGTLWFYIGIPIALIGFVPYLISSFQFLYVPLNSPVFSGLYRYSRHPQYVARVLMFIGVGIATASWVFLIVSILFIGSMLLIRVPQEEKYCLDTYGNAYREYIDRTHKWIGFPRQIRQRV